MAAPIESVEVVRPAGQEAPTGFVMVQPDGRTVSPLDVQWQAECLLALREGRPVRPVLPPLREPVWRAAELSLATFIERAWAQVEPATRYRSNWHIGAMCEHLEAVYRREIRDLVINVPPGFMKSLTTCVFWPAWMWAKDPSLKLVFASYSNEFAERDAGRMLTLVQSEQYRVIAPGVEIKARQPKISDYSTTKGGSRVALGVGGGLSGRRADIIVVDDPLKLDDGHSEAARDAVASWWNVTAGTRGGARGLRRVVIMQRLHQNDLSGVFLEQGAEHLVIPMEYGGTTRRSTWGGFSGEPRTTPGELAWPDYLPGDPHRGTSAEAETRRFVESQKRTLGAAAYSAMYQQEPEPETGNVWKREWFRYYDTAPQTYAMLSTSWDMTFKGGPETDYVVGLVVARVGGDYYVVHEERGRWDFTETLAAFKRVAKKFPDATAHYVEDTANGPAIISSLRREVSGVIAAKPEGDKYSRAQAVAPMLEAGNVHLPKGASWVDEFVGECTRFPNGRHDDRVDALSQALNRMRKQFVW